VLKLSFGHYRPKNAHTVNFDIFCSFFLPLNTQSCTKTTV